MQGKHGRKDSGRAHAGGKGAGFQIFIIIAFSPMYLLPSSAAPDASTFSGIPRKILQKIKLNQEQNRRLTMMCLHERPKENTSKQKQLQ